MFARHFKPRGNWQANPTCADFLRRGDDAAGVDHCVRHSDDSVLRRTAHCEILHRPAKRSGTSSRSARDAWMRSTGTRMRPTGTRSAWKIGSEGYPPDLETLVKGVQLGASSDRKIRFLRRIPVDPTTARAEWGLRAVQDDPDSTSWGGKNVFDVYSKSTSAALDGTKYSDW